MLVKILTEHGTKPTVVVWDAGSSGRKEVYPEYKGTRSTRPDLLAEQWPHFEPLVEAFGYTNIRLDGFEADDVIATLAERAREQRIPVVIVTGDRDAFQLIDPEGIVKVMATSRGITETKLYDHPAVIDRYGIAPELIPDFYGLKGDTSDNIPGVPGIGDKTAATLLQTYGDLEGVLGSVDKISGAKRKQNLVDHAEDARVSKMLATMRRDLPVDLDVAVEAGRAPDRSKLREVFREFELRDPLRRLEEFLGAEEAAPAPVAETTLSARVRAGRAAGRRRASPATSSCSPCARREIAEGELLAVDPTWRFAVAGADEILTGTVEDPAELVAARRRARGRRPRRQGARRRAAEPRPRHADRRLHPRAGAPRLPAARAARGARASRRRSRTRSPPRRCSCASWRSGSASRSSRAT